MTTNPYEDMLDLPRPVSGRRCPMSNYDRAAQFSPFAALTGFEETIEETGRLTDRRIELDEMEVEQLNALLQQILQKLPCQVCVTYFTYDDRKAGGMYITRQGTVKKIDSYCRCMLLTDGTAIPLREILRLQLEEDA